MSKEPCVVLFHFSGTCAMPLMTGADTPEEAAKQIRDTFDDFLQSAGDADSNGVRITVDYENPFKVLDMLGNVTEVELEEE